MSDDSGRPLLVEQHIRVKTYDIDFVGHVNNIVYIRWLEDLRLQLLDEYYPLREILARSIAPVIVSTTIHYRQAIVLDEERALARMWIDRLERATFHLAAEFLVEEGVKATATQRGTFVNTATMRPVRIPERLRERFAAWPSMRNP